MFCLRYFLPILLFFPFPTAPSFLLLLFLASMTTQHRPCAYCSLLLSAILVSTCSWNIASLDVSPVYPSRFKSTSQPSSRDRKTMLSKSSVTPSIPDEFNPIVMDASFNEQTSPPPPPVEAYELKSVHRCWFHTNIAKPFDPIWSADEYHSTHEGQSSRPPHSSSIPQLKEEGNLDEPITETEDKITKSDEKVKQPRRQLNTLLSPLWSPIRRLSSIKTNGYCGEESEKNNHETEINEGSKHSSNTPGSNASDRTFTQTYYRSSFSRTPLLYTYFIRHIVNIIQSYLPSSPMIYRLMSILNQNLPMLSKLSRLTEFFNPLVSVFKMIHERSCNMFNFMVNFSSNPIYVGWNDLFSIRIVMGSPPPVMMSKP